MGLTKSAGWIDMKSTPQATVFTYLDGLPIYDATSPMVIHVVSRDIKEQKRKDPENCAIAKACQRELSAERVRVHLSRTYVKFAGSNFWLRFQTSNAARTEIAVTDKGGTFAEGSYMLLPINHKPKRRSYRTAKSKAPYSYQQSPHELQGVRQKSPVVGGRPPTNVILEKE
jgi:hypothetical protein